MYKLLWSRPFFRSLLRSYIFLLIFVIMINLFVYGYTVTKAREQAGNANRIVMGNFKSTLDSKFGDILRLQTMLALEPSVRTAISIRAPLMPKDRYAIYTASKILAKEAELFSFINSLYIYVHSTDTVISTSTHKDSLIMDQAKEIPQEYSYEQFMGILRNTDNVRVIPATSGIGQEAITYLSPFPNIGAGVSDSTLVIDIKRSKINELIFSTDLFEEAITLITDIDGNVIFSSSSDTEMPVIDLGRYGQNQAIPIYMNGEDMMMTYARSSVLPICYVSLIPNKVFWREANLFFTIGIISFGLCVFIGVMAACFIGYKRYVAIDRTITDISKRTGIEMLSGENELLFISGVAKKISDVADEVSSRVILQDDTIRKVFWEDIYLGRKNIHASDLAACALQYGVHLPEGRWCMAMISIPDGDPPIGPNMYQSICSQLRIICDKYDAQIQLVTQFVESSIVALTGFPAGYSQHACEAACRKINDEMQADAQILLKRGCIYTVSNLKDDLTQLNRAYTECYLAARYADLHRIYEAVFFSDIKFEYNEYYFTIKKEEQFIEFIRIGNWDGSYSILLDLIRINNHTNEKDKAITSILLYDITAAILKIVSTSENHELMAHYLNNWGPQLNAKLANGEYESAIRILFDATSNICRYFKKAQVSPGNRFVGKVVTYIDENFTSPDINVSYIGNMFDISPSYISKLFREQLGVSILQYISQKRIEYSKELLGSENISIEQISARSGFDNVGSYIRVFKRFEYITPGKYRDNLLGRSVSPDEAR